MIHEREGEGQGMEREGKTGQNRGNCLHKNAGNQQIKGLLSMDHIRWRTKCQKLKK